MKSHRKDHIRELLHICKKAAGKIELLCRLCEHSRLVSSAERRFNVLTSNALFIRICKIAFGAGV